MKKNDNKNVLRGPTKADFRKKIKRKRLRIVILEKTAENNPM